MLHWVIRLVLTFLVTGPAWAAAGFDAPLKTELIPTGAKTALHCLTFSTFFLRWESEGDNSAVIYILPGKGPWRCASSMKGELHFGRWEVVRVKARYVIMSQRPRTPYGLEFKVFDTGLWRYAAAAAVVNDFTAVRREGDTLILRFRRQVHVDCSLYFGAATACWGRVKALSGLTDTLIPDCRTAYDKAKKDLNVADITGYPATVTYNVEMRVAGRNTAYTPLPGPIVCEP